jgi:hypothetical protein
MDEMDFESIRDFAKKLEKNSLKYSPYKGDVTVEMCVDFSPPEFMDMDYHDLLNSFERVEKIRSTRKMSIFAKKGAPAPKAHVSAEDAERSRNIETNLKKMSTETREMVRKVGKEMEKEEPDKKTSKPEKTPEKELPSEQTIEFETISAEEKKQAEMAEEGIAAESAVAEGKKKQIPEEKPSLEAEPAPEKEEPVVPEKPVTMEAPTPEKPVGKTEELTFKVSMPAVLEEDPNEAADRVYNEMHDKVKSTLGTSVDERELKKKMLSLTKQLFKEKSTNKREELKAEIAVLKNILSGKTMKGKGKKKVTKGMTHSQLLESIVSNQKSEFASTKEKITGPFRKQLESAKKKFYESIPNMGPTRKKEIYDNFVLMLHSLSEQIPEVVQSYQDYLMQKHIAELEKLKQSLGSREKKVATEADERESAIRQEYPEELSTIHNILTREIENTVEEAGGRIAPVEKEGAKPAKDEDKNIVYEINDLDEGTLLYYLHSKDREYYKKYERRSISKAEALLRAKALMAEEKGLSDSMIRKYFSDSEE